MAGILYVLRTGSQWKAMPREFGSGSAIHDYLQEWTGSDMFATLWRIALHPIIQIAAVAVSHGGETLEAFEAKLKFDRKKTNAQNPRSPNKLRERRCLRKLKAAREIQEYFGIPRAKKLLESQSSTTEQNPCEALSSHSVRSDVP